MTISKPENIQAEKNSIIRRWWHRFSSALWTAITVIVVLLGLTVGLFKLALPAVDRWTEDVEGYLSKRLQQKVSIGEMKGQWVAGGPRLDLENLQLGELGELQVDHARLQVDLFYFMHKKQFSLLDFALSGIHLDVGVSKRGDVNIKGLKKIQTKDPLKLLFSLGQLHVIDTSIKLDLEGQEPLNLDHVDIIIHANNNRLKLLGQIQTPLQKNNGILFKVNVDTKLDIQGHRDITQLDFYSEASGIKAKALPPVQSIGVPEVLSGVLGGKLWLKWLPGQFMTMNGQAEVEKLVIERKNTIQVASGQNFAPRWLVDEGTLKFAFRQESNRSRLRLNDLKFDSNGRQWSAKLLDIAWQKGKIQFISDHVDVNMMSDLALVAAPISRKQAGLIADIDLRGIVENVQLEYVFANENHGFQLKGHSRLSDMRWNEMENIPGISGLSASLSSRGKVFQLAIDTPELAFQSHKLFDDPLFFQNVKSEIQIKLEPDQWIADIEDFSSQSYGIELNARARLNFEKAKPRPVVDIAAYAETVEAVKLHKFWPKIGLKPKTRQWLRSAILSGEAENTSFLLHGDLNEWPFTNHQGRMEVRTDIHDAQLKFLPDWPVVKDIKSQLSIVNRRLVVEASDAMMSDAHASQATAEINDLKKGILTLRIKGNGRAHQLLGLIEETPLAPKYQPFYQDWSFAGPADLLLDLKVNLKHKQVPVEVNGLLWPHKISVSHNTFGFSLEQLEGQVVFDRTGFVGHKIEAQYKNNPVLLEVATGSHTQSTENHFEAQINGLMPADDVFDSIPELGRLMTRFHGQSDWQGRVIVNDSKIPQLTLNTDLVGIQIDLPAPVGKAEGQAVNLKINTSLPLDKGLTRVRYGEILSAAFIPGQSTRALFQFGAKSVDRPTQEGLLIRGEVDDLNVWSWISDADELFAEATNDDDPWLQGVDVQANRLYVMSKLFTDVHLTAWPEDGNWKADIQGKGIDGTVSYTSSSGQTRDILTAEFDTLHWPKESTARADLTAKPETYPSLNLLVSDLYFGDLYLGQTRMEAFPIPHGLQVEQLVASNPKLDLNASGRWSQENNHIKSTFKIHMTSESLGDMLDGFGYSGVVKSGQTIANMDVWWEGAPTSFKMEKLEGTMSINVGAGRILEVDAGAGRLLGLFSLRSLPRRLLLDFSDIFGKGLAFDKITGDFVFNRGLAHTDGLR
ncbi:MAG: YhdP family protein, partial [bacterium]